MKKYQITTFSILFFVFLSFGNTAHAQHWSITNIAGDGTNGDSGFMDGEDALETPIPRPTAMAVDPDKNIYFTVVGAVVPSAGGIYKISSSDNSVVHIYDSLDGISGIAIDAVGNIFYARGNNMTGDPTVQEYIYKINTSGVTSTVAGDGISGPPPISTSDSDNHIGNAAGLALGPNGDYLYYTSPYLGGDDPTLNYIQRINLSSETTERYVGAGGGDEFTTAADGDVALTADIAMGHGLDWDSEGNLYFATYDNQIKKVIDGKIYHVAGTGVSGFDGDNGPAADATLDLSTSGFVINDSDELILCDTENQRVRKFQLSTNEIDPDGIITTFCGTGDDEASGDEGFNVYNGFFKLAVNSNIKPYDIFILDDDIYFSDKDYRVRRAFICKNPEVIAHSYISDAICIGDNVTINLDAQKNDGTQWEWYEGPGGCNGTPLVGEIDETITILDIQESKTYSVIGSGGCTNNAECYEITVDLTCKAYFNAITPNGDGLNDFVDMPGLANYPINTVTFYNRWGDILEVIENYDSNTVVWAGTNGGGDPVDSGTYYFTAEAGSELITSGWVQVIREE